LIPQDIVFHSAGPFAVAVLALIMAFLQVLLLVRKPTFKWYGWGAAISLSGVVYAIGIFGEYNTPAGAVNRFAGILEFSAIVFLIHCSYGFSFSYLGKKSYRFHLLAGIFHGLILVVLWTTDAIVAERFVARNLMGLPGPFVEPALGALGPVFVFYGILASIGIILLWVGHRDADLRHRTTFLTGFIFWLVLAAHDGLVSMRLQATPYLMEYGLLGFAVVVLWVVFSGYADSATLDEYTTIAELASEGIVLIQEDMAVFTNPACGTLFGGPVAHAKVADFIRLVVPEDRQRFMAYYRALLESRDAPESMLLRITRADGEEKIIETSAKRVLYRKKSAILAVLRDVTQRIQDEQARKQNEEKIERLKKMESLGLLAGGVAHDLNNVLSGIVGYPDLILMDLPEDSKLRRPIKVMQESGQRAAAIVQDLLTVARGVAVGRETLNLNEVIRDYLSSPEFDKLRQFDPGVAIEDRLDEDLLNIKGSAFHVRKAVMNLVSNASEAIEAEGRVRISTSNRYIDRRMRGYQDVPAGEYAVLTVEDSGPGIAPENLHRIFEPFFTKKVMGRSGTGLGLTTVWNVVQDHRGFVDVISGEGGTRFTLYFPATRDAVSDKAPAVPLTHLRGKGQTILVIDDVESQREISCRMLQTLGYQTEAVASGEAAVAYLKTHRADLLLLDMIMDPGIDGRETYARIKQFHPDQKAIIVSGYAETEQVAQTLATGAGQFLKKPLLLEDLGLAVKRELERPSAISLSVGITPD
jgi:PAS domain S-box-containing protein